MPKIATILSDGGDGQKSISLLLTRDALFLDPDGIPSPGIALSAPQARALAERLFMLASRLEGEETETAATAAAILVVHDGTQRGDRAVALALTMARDGGALLYLHVQDQPAWHGSGDIIEPCARRLGGMQGIAARCAEEAARHGVRMKPCVISIDGQRRASVKGIVPSDKEIAFAILPRPDASVAEELFGTDVGRYIVWVR